jgi:hypothetical protein
MMIEKIALALALVLGLSSPALSGSTEQVLRKLAPEFRAHQACILRGLAAVRREPRLRAADRMKTSILSPALLEGTKLTANGGAVRSRGHWYALSFGCELTSDLMTAKSFSFKVGAEIPERDWKALGLWR